MLLNAQHPVCGTLPVIQRMKSDIEKELSALIGLDLTRTTRAANIECLKFGFKERTDKEGTWNIGLYGLHIQAPWRIVSKNYIMIGSLDLYEPVGDRNHKEDFNWDEAGKNLRDKKLENLLLEDGLKVSEVLADNYGGLDIGFENTLHLHIFPALSKKGGHLEFWRLIDNTGKDSKHWVVGRSGMELIE